MKRPFQLAPLPSHEFMWLPSSTSLEQVVEQIDSMRRLETSSYVRRDYLRSQHSPYPQNSRSRSSSSNYHNSDNGVTGPISPPSSPRGVAVQTHPYINEGTRHQMVDLLYEIADYCHFRRETVAYAVYNVMDRYLSLKRHAPLKNTSDFQLVASASLYISVKLLEPVSMDVHSLSDLSKGAFGPTDVTDTEKTILFALQWNVAHGPTPIAFVQHFLTVLQLDLTAEAGPHGGVDSELFDDILEQAQYQVEIAVAHYSLTVTRNLSDIALAACWNALESQLDCPLAIEYQNRLWKHLAHAGFDVGQWKRLLAKVQLTLCKLQYNGQQSACDDSAKVHMRKISRGSHFCTKEDEQNCLKPDSFHHMVAGADADADAAEWVDETERNSDGEASPLIIFPSPISVITNHLSANYSTNADMNKMKTTSNADADRRGAADSTNSTAFDSYYDLSFLRRLFFA